MLKHWMLALALAGSMFAVTVPRASGQLNFTVPGRGPVKLSSYEGKVILVAVFITNCDDCQRTTQRLVRLQQELGPKGLQVVGLAFADEDKPDVVRRFGAQYKVNYPIGIVDFEQMAKWGQLTREMHPSAPILFFIDRHGYIQGQYTQNEPFMMEQYQDANIRGKLKRLIEQPVTAGRK